MGINNVLVSGGDKKILLFILFIVSVISFVGTNAVFFVIPLVLGSLVLLKIYDRAVSYGGGIFHPLNFISIILLWAFLISPLYSVYSNYYMVLAPVEIDWFLGVLKIYWIYFFCIIFFMIGVYLNNSKVRSAPLFSVNNKKLFFYAIIFLSISFIAQTYIYISFGGIWGYMTAWSDGRESFEGLGAFFMLSESFPIILFMTVILFTKEKSYGRTAAFLIFLILVFLVLKLAFGGLRGSRSNTIWGLFWALGIIHIFVRPLKYYIFILGAVCVLSFMQVYSLYKSFGVNAFDGGHSFEDTGRFERSPIETLLITDFSRAGVNALTLEKQDDFNYEPKYGQTYISSILKIVPFVNSNSIYNKNAAGAEAFYGQRISLESGNYHNSRIFGYYGEGFLNFGWLLPIFLFTILGYVIAGIHKYSCSLALGDVRSLLIPFYTNLCVMFLLADSDNVIFFFFKNGLIPILFVYLICSRFSKTRRFV